MRRIDADALIPLIKMGECNMYDEYCQGRNGGIEFAVNQVKQMPTIEPEPDWNELLVICDNCGHAIHIKRENAQTIEPERKKGKWLPDTRTYMTAFVCSECKRSLQVETVNLKPIWSFCPNCGADMRGE